MPLRSKYSRHGFTLIELLIVIVIIGILAGLLLIVINPALYLARARDSRRISDIRALASTISFAISGGYIKLQNTTGCSTCKSITGTKDMDGTNGWVKFIPTGSGGLSEFTVSLPEDPLNNSTYYFEFASDGNKFELNAKLEDPSYHIKLANEGGTDMTKYEAGTSLTLIP